MPQYPASLISGGGVLTYVFLKREGYKPCIREIASVKRDYQEGKPICTLEFKLEQNPFIIIDDILASGQTINSLLAGFAQDFRTSFVCLIASTNIPQGGSRYRERNGATIPKIERVYSAQLVNGIKGNCPGNKIPSILSARYLITKAMDNNDYNSYLSKKIGGAENISKIIETIMQINREPIDLLRRDPLRFIRRYS